LTARIPFEFSRLTVYFRQVTDNMRPDRRIIDSILILKLLKRFAENSFGKPTEGKYYGRFFE